MKKKTLGWMAYFILVLLGTVTAAATVVVDASTGLPLPKASVFDKKGNLVGVCSDDGLVPRLSPSLYPLSLRCMGYSSASIETPDIEKVSLLQIEFKLPELTVDNKKHQVLHIIGYVREYSTISTYTDTVMLFREKTVDFMIPARRTKHYKGWTYPRVLASKSYYHFSDANGLDSVSKYFSQNFSWSDLVGVFKSREIPHVLRDVEVGNDTIFGKFSPSSLWKKRGNIIMLDNDILADKNNQTWAPELFRLFSMNVDFIKFYINYLFHEPGSNVVLADDIARMSFIIESNGRGKNLRSLFHTLDPIYMNTYGEIYITDKEYMTVKEAVKWEKRPPLGDDIGIHPPEDAPQLQPVIAALVDRVNNFDVERMLINKKTDPYYHVMKKFEKKRKKKGIVSRILNR